MKEIFISYTTCDKDYAMALVDFLESRQLTCFIAPRDVEKGHNYASSLMKAIDDCKLVILVASAGINTSPYVLNEIDAIVAKQKPMLPVFIEDFQVIDDIRFYIGRMHWIIAYPGDPKLAFEEIYSGIEHFFPLKRNVVETPAKNVPVVEATEEKKDPSKTTVFDYYPERGIMINPKDHQRNVSFRTDTFVNMMRGVYEKIENMAGAEEAEKTFFDSGYVSGKSFAEKIEDLWNIGYSLEDIKFKFKKWCEFDSAVGWGNFTSEIVVDEENDDFGGIISISEPFIVDYKKKSKICGFIKGYCSGVAETLLNNVEVELVCKECPMKSKLKTKCIFEIVTK